MGTTSQKLTYLSETKTQLKDMINYGLDTGEKITSETTFRNYVKSLFDAFIKTMTYPDVLYNNLPKVTGEGTSVTLNDTVYAPMRVELSPSALEQETTSGKNLFNYNQITTIGITTKTERGMKLTCTADGRFGSSYTVNLPMGNYRLVSNFTSSPNADIRMDVLFDDNTHGYYSTNSSNFSFGNQSKGVKEIKFYFQSGTSAGTWVQYDDMMIIPSSSTDYTFEEYTGGIASPNPQYPQQIHTVSGENTITISNSDNIQIQTYPLSLGDLEYCKIGDYEDSFVRTSGKNLLNRATCEENKVLVWATGLTTNNTDSLVSDYIEASANEKIISTYRSQVFFYNSNKEYLGCLQTDGTTIAKANGNYFSAFTIPNESSIKYIKLGFRSSINNNLNMTTPNIMSNKGDTLLPYEPYGSGEWYLKKNISKTVLDGTEDWKGNTSFYTSKFANIIANTSATVETLGISNHFKVYGYNYRQSNQLYFHTNGNLMILNANNVHYTAVDDWKDLLEELTPSLYIPVKTPTYTLLSDTLQTQLEAIWRANSYDEQTNVSQENNDLPFVIKISAIRDLSGIFELIQG